MTLGSAPACPCGSVSPAPDVAARMRPDVLGRRGARLPRGRAGGRSTTSRPGCSSGRP